jgi:hypothetical protein
MKIVSLKTSLVLLVYWEFHFHDSIKNRERKRDYHSQRKMPTAICQMKNSHLPIFEQDKVLTWQKLLLRDFQKGLFLKQEWFSVKCLLASAIEIALNLNEIWLSKIPRAEVELPSTRAISEGKSINFEK